MNAKQVMLCWNPGTDLVTLIPYPDEEGKNKDYRMRDLACWRDIHKMSFEKRKLRVFIAAMHLIIRDKCNPIAVHKALLKLEEYYDGCADDMPGIKR